MALPAWSPWAKEGVLQGVGSAGPTAQLDPTETPRYNMPKLNFDQGAPISVRLRLLARNSSFLALIIIFLV